MTQEEIDRNRRAWLDALRSGKYQQAKGRLRRGECYCCLGVACSVLPCGHKWNEDNIEGWLFDGACGNLHNDVAQALDMPFDDETDAAKMNDSEGKTFAEIAAHFERKWGIE